MVITVKTLVVYKSSTGFSKKYACIIADGIGCETADFHDVTADTMANYECVVYGSRLHAGKVDGLSKAKDMFNKSSAKRFVVFATGGTPNSEKENIDAMWANNFSPEELAQIPHFYCQGGMYYEKMGLVDKTLMKAISTVLKAKKDKDDYENGFSQAITGSYDISSEAYAAPIIEYLKSI